MKKKINTSHTETEVMHRLNELQKDHLSFDEILEIEEDFLHQGLEYWLNDFRKANSLTQKQLAESMGISQPAVCQLLKRPSRLATLGRIVRAMGGQIDITVTKNGKTTSLLFGTPVNEVVHDHATTTH